jgi:ATP-dependent helicase/nuclease subunit A
MEPEKNGPILNDEQRAAAFCTNNAVVAAGAGSGKTFVLASRYAWLVTERNCRVREILCLTFTRKAAAQMYRRIYLQLAGIAREDSGERGKKARQALDEFAQARIQTLDSYCSAVVKQAANRYGISPDFTIDESRCEQLARDEALPFLIANRNHPAFERLYHKKSPAKIVDDIITPALFNYTHIDSPPDPKRDMEKQFSVICEEWKKQVTFIGKKLTELAGVYSEKLLPGLAPLLDQCRACIVPSEKELAEYFGRLVEVTQDGKQPHISAIERSDSHIMSRTTTNFLQLFSSLVFFNLSRGTRYDNPVKDILRGLRDFFGEFSSLAVYCIQAGLIYSVLTLLSDPQRRYIDKKRITGIVTHTDVARLARTILLEQHDIRHSEKE